VSEPRSSRPPPTGRQFTRALFAWHADARRDLSVRRATAAWPILVAEVMSQQTQIERVGPAWERFVARWPTPADLGTASTRDVLTAWAGLGYNRRALALRAAARAIVREHDGQVPDTVARLERLPGIGPYTARAVAATAFGVPVAPLDVNVRRVVVRVLGADAPGFGLQAHADRLVSRADPRAWLDAVMDLAVLVCRRRDPTCEACPVRALCRSRGTAGDALTRARSSPSFPSTNRWLRGRLLATVRDAPAGTWIRSPPRLGEHGSEAVRAAVRALEADGFIEVRDDLLRLR
jgi:A/G-specific adenine glycosylase